MNERETLDALASLVGSRRKARTLLARTTLRHLAEAPPSELERFLPDETGRRFRAALRLARAVLSPTLPDTVVGPAEAYAHLHPYLTGRETERFVAIACDCRYQVLATTIVAEGSPASVDIRPADVFAVAVRHRALAVVLGHNHPSGQTTPSADDYELTQRLVEGGRLLGIDVLDHLVVGGDGFWSLLHGDRAVAGAKAARSRATY